MLDRWIWLKRYLPKTKNGEKLIDIGCGSGGFSIGLALRGYHSLGLSWDQRNQDIANLRAQICNANNASFEVLDVRGLDKRKDLVGRFDIAICLENIEHIIDDRKLICDIAACLKPGGRLLLTTPSLYYVSISDSDQGPFLPVENGGHVRRGYSKSMLYELCKESGLVPEGVDYISGFFSQKITGILFGASRLNPLFAWIIILPLRLIPPLLDNFIAMTTKYPYYCICLHAFKPRF